MANEWTALDIAAEAAMMLRLGAPPGFGFANSTKEVMSTKAEGLVEESAVDKYYRIHAPGILIFTFFFLSKTYLYFLQPTLAPHSPLAPLYPLLSN